jgi:hypothetical protein
MHAALGDLMSFFPLRLNRMQAEQIRFTLSMNFSGPGGGSWTVWLADGACAVSERHAARADLVLAQSPDCFMKTCLELHDPMAAVENEEISVQGVEYLDIFARLFPHHLRLVSPSSSNTRSVPSTLTVDRAEALHLARQGASWQHAGDGISAEQARLPARPATIANSWRTTPSALSARVLGIRC